MSNTIYTYTPDMTRPNCPDCGSPVEATNTPETAFEATCSSGHTRTYQLEDEDDSEGE